MTFDSRQIFNMAQTFGLGILGSSMVHKVDHMWGLAVTGLSISLAAHSLYKAKKLKQKNVSVSPRNLLFMTRKRCWDIQVTASVIMSLPIMTSSPIYWWGLSIAGGVLANIGIMHKTEATVARYTLSFYELSDHPMIDDTSLRSNITKTSVLDWLSHQNSLYETVYSSGLLTEEDRVQWDDRWHRLLDAGAIQDVNGHLHISIKDRVFLEFKDDAYHWYGSPQEYACVMQKLLCAAIYGAVQDDPLKDIITPRTTDTIYQQMHDLTEKNVLSAIEWWDSIIYNNGVYNGNPYTSEISILLP